MHEDPTASFPRCAGVLLHPPCLPGAHGIGDLGAGARRFVDWLASAGVSLWQVLPLVPPGGGDSPYATWSALAGNRWLVSLDALGEVGLLAPDAVPAPLPMTSRIDYAAMQAVKGPALAAAAARLCADGRHALAPSFERFRAEATWAAEAALFAVIRSHHGDRPWWEWDAALRDREPKALAAARGHFAEGMDAEMAVLFLFEHQWAEVRGYCRAKGVRLMGDMPIYVDADSVDVWSNQGEFQLDQRGRSTGVAGVPPDYFSEKGQLWGNPLYDWERMASGGFRWWIARVRRALEHTDLVRMDHFRGFANYWEVEPDAKDARSGRWRPGPGLAFFTELERALGGRLPIVAEDLGIIDEPVRELRRRAGLPGMRVLQFAFGGGADNPYLPHHHERHSVVYTGTHDNDTTAGWWRAADRGVRDHFRRYYGRAHADVASDVVVHYLVRTALASVAHTAIVPMQDVLGLGSEGRLNTPGEAAGNWTWRATPDAFAPERAAWLRELVALYGRSVER
jgi:4-alpha-glucanotransferase